MENAFSIGCRVIFFDSQRRPHEAIVSNWFHGGPDGQTVAERQADFDARGVTSPMSMPCCNVVWVSGDPTKQDPYGRQTERATSQSHWRLQGGKLLGNCWAWPSELEEATANQL